MSFAEMIRSESHAGRAGKSSSLPVASKASHLPLPTRIAVVGNYLPRECGIATFTTDLCNALAAEYGEGRLFAIPVNDPDSSYDYPEQVRLELTQEDIASYERAADFLNFNSNDLVCLQHEYGIYGGAAGRYILALLRSLKMPLVTTLHTVLRKPDANQRIVLEEIAQLSDRMIVMSELAAQLLREVYAVPSGKIDVIPHGVPDMNFMDPNYFKDRFGTEGKSVLLTFGLLSPNKGIENVIRALPAILARHPKVVYIVSGVTHPHIRRREVERYCEELQAVAEQLSVSSHFDNEQSLCQRGRACGACGRGRHLHHSLSAGGADCFRHIGHRAGSGQGNYLYALLALQGAAGGEERRDCPV
jgi:glycosyltransferase involved in cell wall biosynthesis